MIVQSIQPKVVCDKILKDDIVFSSPDFSIWDDKSLMTPQLQWGFADAYEWMAQELRKKCPNKNDEKYPFWAWAWSGDNGGKYIDKNLHDTSEEKEERYLLTLDIEEERLLLSDFELWHYVLNYWPISLSSKDKKFFDSFEKSLELNYYNNKPVKSKELDEKIRDTWHSIFSIKAVDDYFISDLKPKQLKFLGLASNEKIVTQACFWNIEFADILNMEKI